MIYVYSAFMLVLWLSAWHKNSPDDFTIGNVTGVLVGLAIFIAIISGLAIWKSVQFPFLRELMGGYDNARVVHFFAMTFIVSFVMIHLLMVALVPATLKTMLFSRKQVIQQGADK